VYHSSVVIYIIVSKRKVERYFDYACSLLF